MKLPDFLEIRYLLSVVMEDARATQLRTSELGAEDKRLGLRQALDCNQKARAFLWMLARLAGWDGS